MPDAGKLTSALDEIRAEVVQFALPKWSAVPRLLAAVEAALALHQMEPGMFPPQCVTCTSCDNDFGDLVAEIWPCPTVAAISRALLGEDANVT